jgi:phosphomannomutase
MRLKANASFLIDTGAEKLFLVYEEGRIVHDDVVMFIVSYLVMKINKDRSVAIAMPISTSSIIGELAVKFGVKVKRTAISSRSIMA